MQNFMSCAWLAGVWAVRVGGELVFGEGMCFTRKKRVKTANRGHLARNIVFVAVVDMRPVESSTLFRSAELDIPLTITYMCTLEAPDFGKENPISRVNPTA